MSNDFLNDDPAMDDALRLRPTRKRKKRKVVLGIVPRVLIIIVGSAVMIVMSCAFVAKIAQPYEEQHVESQKIASLNRQLKSTNESNATLQADIDYLHQPAGIETAARTQGFLKPGEVSIVINTVTPPAPATSSQHGFAGMIQNAWSHLFKPGA